MSAAWPVAEARGVARRYGAVDALAHVTLAARAGEVLALLGPSGAGKSTLLRLLHLLERPDAGEVRFQGRAAPEAPRARLAALRRFALVQQRPGFLRADARDNVAFPLVARGMRRADARAAAEAALERVGLAHRARHAALALSGGEAQRVATARALVAKPDVLLLDEFTNQLDPENADLLEDLVREERGRGAAVVVVTHAVSQARRLADRVAFMEAGRVVEEGPTADVLAAPRSERLRRYLERA